jgi:hypothetical protein
VLTVVNRDSESIKDCEDNSWDESKNKLEDQVISMKDI